MKEAENDHSYYSNADPKFLNVFNKVSSSIFDTQIDHDDQIIHNHQENNFHYGCDYDREKFVRNEGTFGDDANVYVYGVEGEL